MHSKLKRGIRDYLPILHKHVTQPLQISITKHNILPSFNWQGQHRIRSQPLLQLLKNLLTSFIPQILNPSLPNW
ncbi:hypothetical protein LINPERHAP1_LOCUS13209 [Linum perenne]